MIIVGEGRSNGSSEVKVDTYMGFRPRQSKCEYQDSREDHWRTTIYPICTCNFKHCSEFKGYCPVRD